MNARVGGLFAIAIASVLAICYGALELAVRASGFPDPGLLHDIRVAAREVGDRPAAAQAPDFGWRVTLRELGGSKRSGAPQLLFLGDSVSAGFGLEAKDASFPALLAARLAREAGTSFVDASTPGFGVDQMLLSLEALAAQEPPRFVVLAYIPHDLWRPARDVNWGYPKPVLELRADGRMRVAAAQPLARFYAEFAAAERQYRLAPWALAHLFANRRYYFPTPYRSYYDELYRGLRARLKAFATKHDARILIVRLASAWPGSAIAQLDPLARDVFAEPAERVRFFDSEPCVRAQVRAERTSFEAEYAYHPSAAGHRRYALCLETPMRELLGL